LDWFSGEKTISAKSETGQVLSVLYDGHCRFCCGGARRLEHWARPGSLRMIDFQAPGALDAFPGIDHETCMRHMILVAPDGQRFSGAEAIVRALATRGGIAKLGLIYYVPGIRQLCDLLYAAVARVRYYLPGKARNCPSGTCRL
jgi:predicted DCC family thiol-disulfide oxidoreductase YuxK